MGADVNEVRRTRISCTLADARAQQRMYQRRHEDTYMHMLTCRSIPALLPLLRSVFTAG
jgi:hypothetical protein